MWCGKILQYVVAERHLKYALLELTAPLLVAGIHCSAG